VIREQKKCPSCGDRHGDPEILDADSRDIQGDLLTWEKTGVPGRPWHTELQLTLNVRHPDGGYVLRLHGQWGMPAGSGYGIVIEEAGAGVVTGAEDGVTEGVTLGTGADGTGALGTGVDTAGIGSEGVAEGVADGDGLVVRGEADGVTGGG
jgi:hypothetical protein